MELLIIKNICVCIINFLLCKQLLWILLHLEKQNGLQGITVNFFNHKAEICLTFLSPEVKLKKGACSALCENSFHLLDRLFLLLKMFGRHSLKTGSTRLRRFWKGRYGYWHHRFAGLDWICSDDRTQIRLQLKSNARLFFGQAKLICIPSYSIVQLSFR